MKTSPLEGINSSDPASCQEASSVQITAIIIKSAEDTLDLYTGIVGMTNYASHGVCVTIR